MEIAHLHLGEKIKNASAVDEDMIARLVAFHTDLSWQKHLKEFLADVKSYTYPLIWIIGVLTTVLASAVIWFLLRTISSVDGLSDSVNRLEMAVMGAQESVSSVRDQVKENKEGLSKLEERMYRRDRGGR